MPKCLTCGEPPNETFIIFCEKDAKGIWVEKFYICDKIGCLSAFANFIHYLTGKEIDRRLESVVMEGLR